MFRSRRFLLWLLPVLLLIGICFPLVDVLDGPDQIGARGDCTAEEHLCSNGFHGCLTAESGRNVRRKAPVPADRSLNRGHEAIPATGTGIRRSDSTAGETVVLLARGWSFLRRSALPPRAPNRAV